MERRDFISNISVVLAATCTGCLAACSKSSDTPSGGSFPFTVNLSSEITGVNSSIVRNGVIVVRLDAANIEASFVAVAVACTHEGTSIQYNSALGHFKCPNHGSEFDLDGSVLVGPAARAVREYNVAITGTTLTITE